MLKAHAEKVGDIITLHLQGRIVRGAEIAALRSEVMECDASVLVLDLAGIDLIDAGGLGAMLELRDWTRSKGIEFRLINVNQLVQQVFEITRLDSVFKISPMERTFTDAVAIQPEHDAEAVCA
jgi:anti-anti-sigma factor